MDLKLISRILGLLIGLLGVILLVCMAFGYFHSPKEDLAMGALGKSVATVFACTAFLIYQGRNATKEVRRKEAIAVVGLSWIACGIFGALPYFFMDGGLSFSDAFFESMSGFTTTGATVINDLDIYPRSILLWRALTQWLGGVGILVLFVALLSYLGVGSKALFAHESSAQSTQGLQARIHDIAVNLWLIYLGLTILCGVGLFILGMTPYQATTYALTALSTGGFGVDNKSLAAYDSTAIEMWLVLFMTLGSISFILFAWLLRGQWVRWKMEEEAKWFLIIILASTLAITADLSQHQQLAAEVFTNFRHALFHVVSIITTTGFVATDFNQWQPFSRILLLVLMCIGGCAGSTAGGLKVGRWLLFAKVLRQQITNAFRPTQVFSMRLNGQLIKPGVRAQTLFLLVFAWVTTLVGTALVSVMEPSLDMDSSLSVTMTCLFNIGPGLAKVGPTENFSFLGAPAKILLTILMLLGRLEFFAVLVLFSPTLWKAY